MNKGTCWESEGQKNEVDIWVCEAKILKNWGDRVERGGMTYMR